MADDSSFIRCHGYIFAGPLRPCTLRRGFAPPHPAPGALPLDPVYEVCWIRLCCYFRILLEERNNCFHGHNKTKATAGNCASTFRQQPFVFPSAPQPVGGINAALPVAFIQFQKPSPGGEGGPLAVDEVELFRQKLRCYRLTVTSSVTFGASFPSKGSLLVVSLPHNLFYRTSNRLPCAKGGAPKGRRDCRSPCRLRGSIG